MRFVEKPTEEGVAGRALGGRSWDDDDRGHPGRRRSSERPHPGGTLALACSPDLKGGSLSRVSVCLTGQGAENFPEGEKGENSTPRSFLFCPAAGSGSVGGRVGLQARGKPRGSRPLEFLLNDMFIKDRTRQPCGAGRGLPARRGEKLRKESVPVTKR